MSLSEMWSVVLRSMLPLLITANFVPSLLILSHLMTEAICSSETSVATRATRRRIPEGGILCNHRRVNLKSDIALTDWALLRKPNVFPMRYELDFYIPDEGFLHSHTRSGVPVLLS
jgi:hypothetical protein